MDYQEIKQKYACDDNMTKAVNANMHMLKSNGIRLTKKEKTESFLTEYIRNANSNLGRSVHIEIRPNGKSLGINWSALGTSSATETQSFIKKLQEAVKFVQNAPKLK